MDSYDGPAVIRQDEKEFTVQCMFRTSVDERSGLRSWRGTFRQSDTAFGLDAAEASLLLPSGEVGAVIVNTVRYDPGGARGTFVGTGPSPRTRA
jgi:hypothetical protein